MTNFQERIKNLIDGGQQVSRPEHGRYYELADGTKLSRCTTYLRAGEEFFMPEKWQGASLIGTDCDQMARDYFVEGPETLRSYNYKHLTQDAFNQLLDGLNQLADSLSDEWTVYADRLFLFSRELGVAGEIDLLFVNYLTEEVVVVDLKTVRSPQYMTPGSDKMKKYRQQLNIYREMAEEMMGGYPVKRLFVLPIHVAYPAYGDITTKAQFLDWIDVPNQDVVPAINEAWIANKGMTAAEYLNKKEEDADDFDQWMSELQSL